MRFRVLLLSLIVISTLTACAKKAPNCNSQRTKDLVIKISNDEIIKQLTTKAWQIPKDKVEGLKYELVDIRTSNFNKGTGCYECTGNLAITGPNGTNNVPIEFKSELSDGGKNHYVSVKGLK